MSKSTLKLVDNHRTQIQASSDTSVAQKKKTQRKNPWGSDSYADLITQAIESAPEKKLTLAQIYEWMVKNVRHFSNQESSKSSAGWKNSIRHNLSLHDKFLRLKSDETSGKSSWWTINKAAGTGKTTRRKSSGKKRLKGQSSTHKTLLKKLSNSNSSTQYFSVAMNNGSLQNLPSFSNATNRKSLTRLSTTSEENESLQSVGSSYSPTCNENEMTYKNTFQNSQTTNKGFFGAYPVHAFSDGYATTIYGNSTYLSSSDAVNNNASYSSGTDFYYLSFNQPYPQQFSQMSPLCDYSPKSSSTDESSFPIVSAEYFKSPHHLSGSFVTSDASRVDSIYKNTPVLDTDTILITDLNSHKVHESPNLIEAFDSNQSSVFLSPESQNFIEVPFVSDYPLETNDNVSLSALSESYCNNETRTFSEKENVEKLQTDNEGCQNTLKIISDTPGKIKPEEFEENTNDISRLTELNLESRTRKSKNYFGSDVVSHGYFHQISGYIPEPQFVDDTDSTQIQNEITRLQSNFIDYQNQYYQLKKEKNVSYNSKEQICTDASERQILSNYSDDENYPDNNTAADTFSVAQELPWQLILKSYKNWLNCSLSCQKLPALDSCLLTNDAQENKNGVKRICDEHNECIPDNLKRSKPECSPKMLDCSSEELSTIPFEFINTVKINELEKTSKELFHQHSNFIAYQLIKSVMLHVENQDLTKSAVNSTFVFLHILRLQTSQEKFLTVLSELLFTLKLTYKRHDENGLVIYSNYNSFFADLMFSHFDYEINFNSVICLYINALDAFISEDFAERHLEESMKKYDEIVPNIVMFLELYLTATSVIDHIKEGNLVNDPVELKCENKIEKFVPSSVYCRKNIQEISSEIQVMWNRRDSYVNDIEYFIRRRFLENDTEIPPPLYNPSLDVLRNILDAIKLQPKYKLISSNLADALNHTAKMNFIKFDNLKENMNFIRETMTSVEISENCNTEWPSDLNEVLERTCNFVTGMPNTELVLSITDPDISIRDLSPDSIEINS